MEESAGVEVQNPSISSDYVAAVAAAGGVKYEPKCKDIDPHEAWNKKHSFCGGGRSGKKCPFYRNPQSRDGFEVECTFSFYSSLYGFYIDRRNIWNSKYMNELRRSLGITI
jgi:hypothetical protein